MNTEEKNKILSKAKKITKIKIAKDQSNYKVDTKKFLSLKEAIKKEGINENQLYSNIESRIKNIPNKTVSLRHIYDTYCADYIKKSTFYNKIDNLTANFSADSILKGKKGYKRIPQKYIGIVIYMINELTIKDSALSKLATKNGINIKIEYVMEFIKELHSLINKFIQQSKQTFKFKDGYLYSDDFITTMDVYNEFALKYIDTTKQYNANQKNFLKTILLSTNNYKCEIRDVSHKIQINEYEKDLFESFYSDILSNEKVQQVINEHSDVIFDYDDFTYNIELILSGIYNSAYFQEDMIYELKNYYDIMYFCDTKNFTQITDDLFFIINQSKKYLKDAEKIIKTYIDKCDNFQSLTFKEQKAFRRDLKQLKNRINTSQSAKFILEKYGGTKRLSIKDGSN